jgi:hypothetical protein
MGYMRDKDGVRLDSISVADPVSVPPSTDGPKAFFTAAGGNQELVSDDVNFYWGTDNGNGNAGTIYKINPATGATITTFTGPVHCAGGDYRRTRDTIFFTQGGDNPPIVWEINKTTGAKIRQWDFTGIDYSAGGLMAWDDTVPAGDVIYVGTGAAGVIKMRKYQIHDDGTFTDLGLVYSGTDIDFGRGQGMTCRNGRLYYLGDDPTYPTTALRVIYRFSPVAGAMVVDRRFSYYDRYESEGLTFHQGKLYAGNRNLTVFQIPWQPYVGQRTIGTLTVLDKLNLGNLPAAPVPATTNSKRLAATMTDPALAYDNTLGQPVLWTGAEWVTFPTSTPTPLTDFTLIDTFTDGDMTNVNPGHVVDLGGAWSQLGIGPTDGATRQPTAGITSNRLTSASPTTSSQVYRNAVVPASADFDIEFDAVITSTAVGFFLALARMTPTGSGATLTSTGSWYYGGAIGNATTPGYVIGRRDAGSSTVVTLATAAAPPTVGTPKMRFRGVGSDLRLFVDGVQVCQVTDTNVTQVGRYGFSVAGSNSGAIDNFRARAVPQPLSGSTTVRPASLPALASGQYYVPLSPFSASTSAALGNGTLRLTPWIVNQSMTVSRLAAEITAVGDVGSKLRLCIYADNGYGYPGALVLDAGQIAGDSATTQELTTSAALTPGVYWIGGVVQSVTTTQPTVRTITNWAPPIPIGVSSLPAANITATGYSITGITGALPTTYPAGAAIITAVPRPIIKVA